MNTEGGNMPNINPNSYFRRVIEKIQNTGAFTPLIYLNALLTLPLLIMAAWLNAPIPQIMFFLLACIIIVFSLVQYNKLRNSNPRLLMSETTQIIQQQLDIIGQKGKPISVNPITMVLTPNPMELPSGDSEEIKSSKEGEGHA